MLETPWVSTPRRSVATSTSAPIAASSCVTPIFSKIDITVSCSASCGTRVSSSCGTLNRSSMGVTPCRRWLGRNGFYH